MKHIVKILSLLVAISAFWIGLLQAVIVPRSHTFMVATDLLCSISRMLWSINGWHRANAVSYLSPRNTSLAAEAKDFLKHKGVDVGSD